MKRCDWFWGSHGCDLPLGHDGTHVCEPYDIQDAIYDGPVPDGGWSWDDCCFKWEPGDEHEFQQDARPAITWVKEETEFGTLVRAMHDGECVFIEHQCSCGKLDIGMVRE